MSKVFEGTLVYANVSPPEATRPIPIKVSCPNFMALPIPDPLCQVAPDPTVGVRAGVVTILEGDALATLARLTGPVGLVLLDGWKDLYLPVLRRSGCAGVSA